MNVPSLLHRIRTRFGEIRPARAPAPINRRRVYAYALIGVAFLIGLAWLNNRSGVAAACLVALVIGLLFVAAQTHRALLTTALAILWWISTAPAVGLLSTAGLPASDLRQAVSQAAVTNVGLGVVVWLSAVLIRSPHPAATVMACWLLNLIVVMAASVVLPGEAWVAGYVVTVGVLAHRSGLLARPRSRRGGGAPDPDDETQAAVFEAVDRMPPAFAVKYGLPVGDGDRDTTVVTGPTGTFALTGLIAEDAVRGVSRGTRLASGGRRLDADINAAAYAAIHLKELARTPVLPVLVVTGEFPDGLLRLVTEPRRGQSVEVLVIRADLVAGRLAYGSRILTTGQVSRIMRRLNRIASTATSREKSGVAMTG